MISLLFDGQWAIFALIVISLVISLSVHEYGHAQVAKWFGDDTAERAGRLTLNPIAHIDPFGLLMVVMVGFGYAKPVPTDPRKFTSRSADLWVAAAGPFMNLVLATIMLNVFAFSITSGAEFIENAGVRTFFTYLVLINLVLMIFNLIPLGPLDGQYILPYFLPDRLRRVYRHYNDRFGSFLLLGLILLQILGVPIFTTVMAIAEQIQPLILFVG